MSELHERTVDVGFTRLVGARLLVVQTGMRWLSGESLAAAYPPRQVPTTAMQ